MNLEAQWITGFTDGEGCFFVGINPHEEMAARFQILPEFTVVQHERDIKILHAFKSFFKCGVVRVNHGDRMCFRVRNFEHLSEIIVPFFEKHQLKTSKRQDFISFRKVILLMQKKEHLTADGISKIRKIVSKMNTGRKR